MVRSKHLWELIYKDSEEPGQVSREVLRQGVTSTTLLLMCTPPNVNLDDLVTLASLGTRKSLLPKNQDLVWGRALNWKNSSVLLQDEVLRGVFGNFRADFVSSGLQRGIQLCMR